MFSEVEVIYFGLILIFTLGCIMLERRQNISAARTLENEKEWRKAIAKTLNTRLGEDQKKIVITKVTTKNIQLVNLKLDISKTKVNPCPLMHRESRKTSNRSGQLTKRYLPLAFLRQKYLTKLRHCNSTFNAGKIETSTQHIFTWVAWMVQGNMGWF